MESEKTDYGREIRFGPFVRAARLAKGWTQARLADDTTAKLGELGVSGAVTQNAIAQYESEKMFPELDKIAALAELLDEDFFSLILRLSYSKFILPNLRKAEPANGVSSPFDEQFEAARLRLLLSGLTRFETIGSVKNRWLEFQQLGAKAKMLSTAEILGFRGIVSWQWNFPALEEFLVCNLDWLDAGSRRLQAVVKHNLSRPDHGRCRYVYFVRPEDLEPGGKFVRFISGLRARLGGDLKDHVTAVPVKTDELQKIRLDFVVANPHLIATNKAVAFENIRRRTKIQYSFRMDPDTLARNVHHLADFARSKGILIGALRDT